MIKLRGPLSVQDEEFLEDIEGLSEGKRNGIIAYVKDKCECIKQENKELLEAARKKLKGRERIVIGKKDGVVVTCDRSSLPLLDLGLDFDKECQFYEKKDVDAVFGVGK